jgi:hypothetical protein
MRVAENGFKPVPRRAVLAMPEYHPPLAGRDALRLDFNENTFAAVAEGDRAAAAGHGGGLTKYPEREGVERDCRRALWIAGQTRCC